MPGYKKSLFERQSFPEVKTRRVPLNCKKLSTNCGIISQFNVSLLKISTSHYLQYIMSSKNPKNSKNLLCVKPKAEDHYSMAVLHRLKKTSRKHCL